MFTLLLFLAVLFIFYKYLSFCYRYWKSKGVKGPEPTFFVGHFFQAFLQKKAYVYEVDHVYRQYKNNHSVVGIYQFWKPFLLALDTDVAREVLVKNFKNFHINGFEKSISEKNDPLLSFNPFFLSGEAWKDKRNEITPALSPARIKTMYPLIEAVCERMTQYLESKAAAGKTLEGKDLCTRFTCDVVTKCGFGADAHSFDKENPEIRLQANKIMGDTSVLTMVKFLFMEMFPSVIKALRIGLVPKPTEAFFRDLMRQAMEHRKSNNNNSQDYLDYLLQMQKKKGLSDLEIAANAITFFLDGLETSAIALAHTLFELANNKDAQEKLRAEINEAMSKHGSLDFDTINQLPYLDQVFHEALRMYPPVGLLNRECSEEMELDIGKDKKLFVEKGTTIMIPVWSIHHDPNIYEEPEKFKPERFNEDAMKKIKDKGQWLAFGDGPRICLGQRFAKVQSKKCITTIIKNFDVSVNKKTITPLRVDPKEFMGMALGGIWLDFKKINN